MSNPIVKDKALKLILAIISNEYFNFPNKISFLKEISKKVIVNPESFEK